MTNDQARSLLRRISIGNGGLKAWQVGLRVGTHPCPSSHVLLVQADGIPQRDCGIIDPANPLQCALNLDSERFTDVQYLDLVRRQIHNLAAHEVDEAIMLDGVRIFDPHVPRTPRSLSEAVAAMNRMKGIR